MADKKRMQGKRVLVTGAGRGIGRGIAIHFAKEGADVVFHYGRSADGAMAAVKEAQGMGAKATAFQADFDDVRQVRQLGNDAREFLGGVDVLVNNAGITMNMVFEKVTPKIFELLYNVNVKAPFFLTQAVAPAMIEQGQGAVINITSIHAFAGLQEHCLYAGTRGAIVAFTRTLAMEFAPKNIRVNAISPGSIEVENYHKVIPDFDSEAFGRNIPVGFLGQPSEIAGVAVFLASDEAKYIIGQTLIVDGGTTSFMPIGVDIGQSLGATFGKGYVPGI